MPVLGVSWQGDLLTLFGLKEGVRQNDGVHSSHPRVFVKLRVDVEEDGHVDFLVGVQMLFLETETLKQKKHIRDHVSPDQRFTA